MSASLTKQMTDLKKNKKRKCMLIFAVAITNLHLSFTTPFAVWSPSFNSLCISLFATLFTSQFTSFFSHIQFSAAIGRSPKKWGFTVKQGAITGHEDNYTAYNITKPSLTMQLDAVSCACISPKYVIHFLQFIDFHQSPDTRSARTKHNAIKAWSEERGYVRYSPNTAV